MTLEILTKIKTALLDWYAENYYAINWFIIGFLVADALNLIAKQKPEESVIAFALAALTYLLVRKGK